MDPFIKQAGHNRWLQLDEFLAQEQANLARHHRTGDVENASMSIQLIANAVQEKQALQALHDEQVRAETPPPAPPPLTREEQMAKPLEKMTWEDGWNIANTSKHGVDPESFKAGMAEVMRRKAQGI
jgi:hypothetical protein